MNLEELMTEDDILTVAENRCCDIDKTHTILKNWQKANVLMLETIRDSGYSGFRAVCDDPKFGEPINLLPEYYSYKCSFKNIEGAERYLRIYVEHKDKFRLDKHPNDCYKVMEVTTKFYDVDFESAI